MLSQFFKKKEITYSHDDVNESKAYNSLYHYVQGKSDSISLGDSSDDEGKGLGILDADVKNFAIAEWISIKLKHSHCTHREAKEILFTATKAAQQIFQSKKNYLDTLNDIVMNYYAYLNCCEKLLDETKKIEGDLQIPNINMPLNRQIKFLEQQLKLKQSLNLKDLNNFKIKISALDLGGGLGVQHLNILKYSIGKWLLDNLNHDTWSLEWSDKKVLYLLLTAHKENKTLEKNKNQYGKFAQSVNDIINIHLQQIISCRDFYMQLEKKYKNYNLTSVLQDIIQNPTEFSVPQVIHSNQFFNLTLCDSELSKIITDMYETMRKVNLEHSGSENLIELKVFSPT